jgi:hypothetical protein
LEIGEHEGCSGFFHCEAFQCPAILTNFTVIIC